MEYQDIKVKIDKTGKVFIEVSGVSGKKCLELTKDVEEMLGGLVERDYKPEFNDEDPNNDIFLMGKI